jgi:6-phosphogluconolactonase
VRLEVAPDLESLAQRAAAFIAAESRAAVVARGRFLLAVSGGTTPGPMLRRLAGEDVPWPHVHLFQTDERLAPHGDPERNLTQLEDGLLASVPLPRTQLHAMPVEEADPEAAAARYAQTLRDVAGAPAVLDLVHLGLGSDGHTASLVPGDSALDVTATDVAVSGPYRGRWRMTLTFRALDRARAVLWVVAGADKRDALARLRNGDRSIPAGRVRSDRALLLADAAAVAPPADRLPWPMDGWGGASGGVEF